MKLKNLLALIVVTGLIYCPLCDKSFEGTHECPNTPTTYETDQGAN